MAETHLVFLSSGAARDVRRTVGEKCVPRVQSGAGVEWVCGAAGLAARLTWAVK